ncbi:MAG: amidohydrolase [Deltaproteobacteria bacterium]|nr:amidohydrolase [Deltaproteobacteria bacterium]
MRDMAQLRIPSWRSCARVVVSLCIALSAACGGARRLDGPTPTAPEDEALVYVNARVLTMDPAHPRARALRIAGGRITDVLDADPPASLSGRRIDLRGAAVLPGLVDAHLHLQSLGAADAELDLDGARTLAEVLDRVRRATTETPHPAWIRGHGWDQNDWSDHRGFPPREALDRVAPGRLVWLERVDGHAVWVSPAVLALANVDARTQDPPGGRVERNATGEPTGIFVDNAIDLVARHLPPPSADEVREAVRRGVSRCVRAGLTGVHDMGTTPESLAALRALEREGALDLRVTAYLRAPEDDDAFEAALADPPDREGLLRVVGMKLFADGALGSRGAALLAPYDDAPDSSGLLVAEPDVLASRARTIHAAGYQLAIHAIGDRGVRVALDAIAAAQAADRSRRHRIEHAQVVAPADFARFVELGVVASMQPTHATSDMPWAESRIGAERILGAYAWRTMLSRNVAVAFGSDAPVEGELPWLGVYSATTRQDPAGSPAGGWHPEQRLTIAEALAAFTRGPAYATGDERLHGVIRAGAVADLTVLDRDPTTVEPAELRTLRALRVVVAGRERQ